MTVSYIGFSPFPQNRLVFCVNGVEVAVNTNLYCRGREFIRLTEDSAPMIEEMLDTLAAQLKADEDISGFFRLGYVVGLRFINACLHDEFIEYFIRRRKECPYLYGKRQFLRFFNQMIGASTTRSFAKLFRELPFLNELYVAFEKTLPSTEIIKNMPQYRTVHNEFIVEFQGYTANHLHVSYAINGHEVLYPLKNKSGLLSTQELLDDCVRVKSALIGYQNIKPFIRKYGGKCAYKILTIIGLDEFLEYFNHIANQSIMRRLPFYPQKIIKEYGFSPILEADEPFVLLDSLEELYKNSLAKYIETNDAEILRNDVWLLYYNRPGVMRSYRFDFTQFNGELQEEILSFMRANYYRFSYKYLFNIYYILCKCIAVLGVPTSILNCNLADAIFLRASLTADKSLSPTTIARHIDYLAVFYRYVALLHNCTKKNPFDEIRVRSRFQYRNPTNPVSSDSLKVMLGKLVDMPMHIQIAVLILLETGARANEVCGVSISDINVEPDEDPVLMIFLEKNHKAREKSGRTPFVRHRISGYLANLITAYIADHQKERSAIETNKLLVYTPSQYRKGSNKPPVILTPSSLEHWLKKLSEPEAKCTARKIRAAVGRAAFAKGLSNSEVAAKLGNTPQIAEAHYNYLTPQSEAALYDEFYRKIFLAHADTKEDDQKLLYRKELYGSCDKIDNSTCNQNRCETCSQRITCKAV